MRTCRTTSASPSKRMRPIERARPRRACAGRSTNTRDGFGNALVVERHLAVELDRDAHGVGQHGAADVLDRRRASRRRRPASAPASGAATARRGASAARAALGRRRRRRRRRGAGASSARELRRHLLRELARRILRRQRAQQPDAGVLLALLAELRERVERRAAPPATARCRCSRCRVAPHDRLVGARRRRGRP